MRSTAAAARLTIVVRRSATRLRNPSVRTPTWLLRRRPFGAVSRAASSRWTRRLVAAVFVGSSISSQADQIRELGWRRRDRSRFQARVPGWETGSNRSLRFARHSIRTADRLGSRSRRLRSHGTGSRACVVGLTSLGPFGEFTGDCVLQGFHLFSKRSLRQTREVHVGQRVEEDDQVSGKRLPRGSGRRLHRASEARAPDEGRRQELRSAAD